MRPVDLPEFASPPLNEVLLGVQFAPIRTYKQIFARDVWNLFKDNFPSVEEQQPLPPAFETFGSFQIPQFQFGLMTEPMHTRYWFMSKDQRQLIQFQNDRLMQNWRKMGDPANQYPRHEKIIGDFHRHLRLLDSYASSLSSNDLSITQCEITYFNIIEGTEPSKEAYKWIKTLNTADLDVETINVNIRSIVRNAKSQPIARLLCDIQTGVAPDGKQVLCFNLTVRGPPVSPKIESAIEFFAVAREIIVRGFTNMTTDSAHSVWGRLDGSAT